VEELLKEEWVLHLDKVVWLVEQAQVVQLEVQEPRSVVLDPLNFARRKYV
jgi:hypothetical protein